MNNSVFTREMFAEDGDEAGVFVRSLGAALTTWAAMRGDSPTVAEAMATFNTTREVIVEAVNDAPWAFLSDETCDDPAKTTIELDGE